MLRRKFLDTVSGLLGGIIALPPKMFAASYSYSRQITLTIGSAVKHLAAVERYGKSCISLVEFAQKANYGFFTNTEKRKTVLYIAGETIKFTADNGFVVLNNQLLQVLYEPFWKEEEVWVPADVLAELLNSFSSQTMNFDQEKKIFTVGTKDINISNIRISEKDNGTLIRIITGKTFKENEIQLKHVNDWLYVEIYKGKADAKALASTKSSGVIKAVDAESFEQSVTIAFRLGAKIDSKEVSIDSETGDILLSIRSQNIAQQNNSEKEELEKQKKDWMVHTIVIDPGHGGRDPGAVGYKNLYEKNIVLPVALKLGKEIHKKMPDVKIVYTRKKDVSVPLWKRTKIANNNNGKLFISIHCNSVSDRRARGFETFFLSAEKDANARDVVLKENSAIQFESKKDKKRYEGVNFVLATMAQNAFIKQSRYLASTIQKSLAKRLGPLEMKNRGVKQGNLYVLVGATMPNILVEMGFISNKREALLLKQKSTQNRIVSALTDGIAKYKKDIESAL